MKLSSRLTELDLLDLLHDYKAELRKLKVKTDSVKGRIREFEEALAAIRGAKEAKLSAAVEARAAQPKKKPGRPPRAEKKPRKPYPLNEWDNLILNGLRAAGKVQINREILEQVQDSAKKKGIFRDNKHTTIKLNQSLVKLSNRRGDLRKVNVKGRGFGYALPEWYGESNRLMKEYKR